MPESSAKPKGSSLSRSGDLKLVAGVVEHGLFLDLADEAIIGGDDGVTVLAP